MECYIDNNIRRINELFELYIEAHKQMNALIRENLALKEEINNLKRDKQILKREIQILKNESF